MNEKKQISAENISNMISSGIFPKKLVYNDGKVNTILYSNEIQIYSSCIGCPNSPCMTYNEKENSISAIPEFPSDPITQVCPTGAISRLSINGPPNIDTKKCILCGICIKRCNVGAIRIDSSKGAVIEINPANKSLYNLDIKDHRKIQHLFYGLEHSGKMLLESNSILNVIQSHINPFIKEGDWFPPFLARNLLRTIDLMTVMRRKGNNSMRMDLIFNNDKDERGVVEVEFDEQILLDAPRDLLEDIAVLVSRYNWNEKEIVPIVIGLTMPNKRSEYWSIIEDINKILNIKIQTVSILSLMICIWNQVEVNVFEKQPFYIDRKNTSYRQDILESILKREINFTIGISPLIEPQK